MKHKISNLFQSGGTSESSKDNVYYSMPPPCVFCSSNLRSFSQVFCSSTDQRTEGMVAMFSVASCSLWKEVMRGVQALAVVVYDSLQTDGLMK